MTIILDGLKPQKTIKENIKKRVNKLPKPPGLLIFSSCPKPESLIYIKKKEEFGLDLGFTVKHIQLDPSMSSEEFKTEIDKKNEDKDINGIIFQLPFYSNIKKEDVLNMVSPNKDVDGLSSVNLSSLYRGKERVLPATARAVLEMLNYYDLKPEGKKIVVVGRSVLVGRSVATALLNRDATIMICHQKTENLEEIVFSADIVISATGCPGLINSKMMHSEQIIIDIGISRQNGVLKGDVDFQSASKKVRAVSPVPGGVGPLTVASLFLNLIDLTEKNYN